MTATLDQDWRTLAACRGHDPEMWSLAIGRSSSAYRQAHAICDGCPVRQPCEDLAVRTNSVGLIFGGRDFPGEAKAATPQEVLCARCGKRFSRMKAWTRYCSEGCRKRNWRPGVQRSAGRGHGGLPEAAVPAAGEM